MESSEELEDVVVVVVVEVVVELEPADGVVEVEAELVKEVLDAVEAG